MKTKKLGMRLFISIIIMCIVTSIINFDSIKAAIYTDLPVSYIDDNFPDSYMPYINALKKAHPNWVFKAVHTGLDWNMALSHETYEVNEGISLVEDIYGAEWKRDGQNYYQDGNYVTASKQAVAYVMDPRNFLCDSGIFQFEALRYVDGVQTVEAVNGVLAPTPMGGEYKSRYKSYGTWYDLGTTYAELIHSISARVGINPVHIASRIRQENSGNIINNSLINGDYGVYNFFNIGAYDSSTGNALSNGVQYARNNGWTSISSALEGGIRYIYDKYVKWGQNTIYFERFDVNNPGTAQWLLGTGYMTNIFGAKNEASITYNAYESTGMLNNAFEFDIPVYENMPEEPASMPVPSDVTFTPDNTLVYLDDPSDSGAVDEFWIRSGPDTLATLMEKIYETRDGQENRTKFTRIGIGNNTLYDKIQYEDGRIGYVLKKWIYEYQYTKVESVSLNTTYSKLNVGDTLKLEAIINPSNATDKTVTWESSNDSVATVDNSGNVRAVGEGNVTITVKTNDQSKSATCSIDVVQNKVSSISLERDEYTLKVGQSMHINPIILPSTAQNKEYSIQSEDSSVVRIDGKNIIGVSAGETIITFITDDGGYKATAKITVNEDSSVEDIILDSSLYLENNIVSKIDINNNTVKNIKDKITTNYNLKFIDIENVELKDEDHVGTGTKIQFFKNEEKVNEYTVIIYGDVDGSGIINARDLLMLQRYILKKIDLLPIQIRASVIDKQNDEPKAVDLLKIQRHILGLYVIEQ